MATGALAQKLPNFSKRPHRRLGFRWGRSREIPTVPGNPIEIPILKSTQTLNLQECLGITYEAPPEPLPLTGSLPLFQHNLEIIHPDPSVIKHI